MMSLWSWVLLASVAIGLFFLSLLLIGRKTNSQATYLFAALLFLLVAINFDNWLFASEVWLNCPIVMGYSRGSILLFGPLIYLYCRSITSQSFRLSWVHLLHLIPFLVIYAVYAPMLYFQDIDYKREYIEFGLSSAFSLSSLAYLAFSAYMVHISIYLYMTLRLIRKEMNTPAKVNYIIPTEERLRWAKTLAVVFSLCFATLVVLFGWAFATGTYRIEINFVMTSAYTVLIYYLGFGIVRNEHLLFPGFARKYQSLNVSDAQKREYAAKLTVLVENEKIFLDPDVTLGKVADAIGIPSGYLSKLINEEHGKNFADYINYYRVEEVKRRLKDQQYDALSIFGIALETGFSSKSSFNSAFKKVTGMTPSDYKKH